MDSPGSKGAAHAKRDRWELRGPSRSGVVPQRQAEIHNRSGVWVRKSDGAVVAEKRGNSRGAKGPCRYHVEARGVSLPACRLYLRLRFFKGQAEARLRCEDKPSGTDRIKLHGRRISREPNAENPPVRFEEGGRGSNCAAAASTLLATRRSVVVSLRSFAPAVNPPRRRRSGYLDSRK